MSLQVLVTFNVLVHCIYIFVLSKASQSEVSKVLSMAITPFFSGEIHASGVSDHCLYLERIVEFA